MRGIVSYARPVGCGVRVACVVPFVRATRHAHWVACLTPAHPTPPPSPPTHPPTHPPGDASFAWGLAGFVSSAKAYSQFTIDPVDGIGVGDYVSNGGTVGIAILFLAVWALLNALRVDQQGHVNNFGALARPRTCACLV